MFRGKFRHNVDEKGRFSLPAKFRETLKNKYGNECLMIVPYLNCLVAYPFEEWKKLEERLRKIDWDTREVRKYLRYVVGSAEECYPDKQGRILLPQFLRDEIRLEKEVILVGLLTYFEIWNPQDWEREYKETKEHFFEILNSVKSSLERQKNTPS